MPQIFRAHYESAERAEKWARECGWPGGDGMLDYIDAHGDREIWFGRDFPDKDAAVAWLVEEIKANKTLFGAGDVDVIEVIEPRRRCKYCTCRGFKEVASTLVDDDGIAEERDVTEQCWNGEG